MKEIKAFLQPFILKDVIEGLKRGGFYCFTVTTAEGTGNFTDSDTDFFFLKYPF